MDSLAVLAVSPLEHLKQNSVERVWRRPIEKLTRIGNDKRSYRKLHRPKLEIAAYTQVRMKYRDSVFARMTASWGSLAEFDQRRALAAFALAGFGEGGDVGVGFEELAQGAAEDAHAGSVDDPDAG